MRTQTRALLTTAMVCLLLAVSTAHAQHYGEPAPVHPGVDTPPHYQPFGDIGVLHDLQLFAPPIINDYGDDAFAANYGWYIQYDRMNVWFTRPEFSGQYDGISDESQQTDSLDDTWGNRLDIGYMTEENTGWNLGLWKTNNTGFFASEVIPGFEIGDPNVDLEAFDGLTSVNAIGGQSLEFSKTFRLPPTEHGLIREPFFGVRWIQTQDSYRRATRTFTTSDPIEFLVIIEEGGDDVAILTVNETDRTIEDVDISGSTDNDMVLAQIGSRWYADRGHWRISAELRGFAGQNFGSYGGRGNLQTTVVRTQRIVGIVPPDFIPVPPPIVSVIEQSFDVVAPQNDSASEFTLGGELRLETQYHLTREISARFGLELLSIGRGVIRSPLTPTSDTTFELFGEEEGLLAVGITMGVEVNR